MTLQEEIKHSVDLLKKGKIILYPTDTIWGIGCDATNTKAVQRIYKLKNRSDSKQLVHMVSSSFNLEGYVDIKGWESKYLNKYWPGAFTAIFKKKQSSETIGIRIPDFKPMLDLLTLWGKPLAVTSANRSGQLSPRTAPHRP